MVCLIAISEIFIMETMKRLIIAMALAASLMPVLPVYAMGLDDDGDEKYAEDIKEAAGSNAGAAAVACARKSAYYRKIKNRREALTPEEKKELDDEFLEAISNDDLKGLERFNKGLEHLRAGANPNLAFNNQGATLLRLAVHAEDLNVVEFLLGIGADANMIYEHLFYKTALGLAVNMGNNSEIARALLEGGANPNVAFESATRAMPLMATALHGNADMVDLLLSKGADVDAEDAGGLTALLFVLFFSKNAEVVRLLTFAGADINREVSLSTFASEADVAMGARNGALTLSLLKLEDCQGTTFINDAGEEYASILAEIGLYEAGLEDQTLATVLPHDLAQVVGDYLSPYRENDFAYNGLVQTELADQSVEARAERRAAAVQAGSIAPVTVALLRDMGSADEGVFFFDAQPGDEQDARAYAEGSAAVDLGIMTVTSSDVDELSELTAEERQARARAARANRDLK